MLSENAQELLEKMWVVTVEEAAPALDVGASASPDVRELLGLGLVEWNGHGLRLTEKGRPEAAAAIRRHRLAERLLVDVLATEQATVDDHACRFEHALVDGVTESICTLLGHPTFCPHGKPIPPGDCCDQHESSVERLIAPLSELDAGEWGQIAYIQMNDSKRLQKLMAMGVLPGTRIALLHRFPSFVFEAGYSQFAVDQEIAAGIYVRLEHDQLDRQES